MSEPLFHFRKHPGISCTTPIAIRQADGRFEARVGVAIMGNCNMTDDEMASAGHDPFSPDWHDNYASGTGETEEVARAALDADLESWSKGLSG